MIIDSMHDSHHKDKDKSSNKLHDKSNRHHRRGSNMSLDGSSHKKKEKHSGTRRNNIDKIYSHSDQNL